MSAYLEGLQQALRNYQEPEGPFHGYSSPYNSTPRYPLLPLWQEEAYGNNATVANGPNIHPSYQWRQWAQKDVEQARATQMARVYQNGVGDVYGPSAPGGYGVPDHTQPLPHSPVGAGADKAHFLREQQQAYANHPDPTEQSLRGVPPALAALARALHDTAASKNGHVSIEIKKGNR